MTVAHQTPRTDRLVRPPEHPPSRNGRWSGFRHLLGARMKELAREREVVFWVFVFPLLLALGLGFAFRNKPADITSIAVVSTPYAENTISLIHNSVQKDAIHAEIVDRADAL